MTEQQLAHIEAQLTQNKRAGFCGMWLDIADVRGLIADCRRLEEMLAAERQRADKAEAALSQVDDVLIVDWINVVDGNYRKALADLVAYNITIHDDPAVSEVAAKRQVAIQQAERERDMLQRAMALLDASKEPAHWLKNRLDLLAQRDALLREWEGR